MKTVKEQCQPPTRPQYDFSDPEWVEGYRDAHRTGWSSAPDMRRGMSYAHGYLTGRLHRDSPSHRVH